MNDKIERRFFVADELTVETRAEGGAARLVGHAAVFDTLSENLGGFREKIAPGAFLESIAADDIRALFNHDPNFVLGRNRSKTLKLAEDDRGLKISIDLPDTQLVRDMVTSPIARGDISQMSIGFSVRSEDQDWGEETDGQVVRTLKRVRLFDVSPVTYPAYPQTDVAVRALEAYRAAQAPDAPMNLARAKALFARF